MGLGGTTKIDASDIAGRWKTLKIGSGRQWSYIGKPWKDGANGLIKPPPYPWNTGAAAYTGQESNNDEILQAFHTGRAYGDFEAAFRFRWDAGHCGCGIIFRAKDARHYYLAHFPCIGQCNRAEHFWALISKVGDSGWTEVLEMEMLHGVASEIGIWHDARLVVKGNTFQVYVDGRPTTIARDNACRRPGAVGLEAWGLGGPSTSFKDLRVRGEQHDLAKWDDTLTPAKNWFLPVQQNASMMSTPGITRAPSGELLMPVNGGYIIDRTATQLMASSDNARTWAPVKTNDFPGGWVHTLRNGKLITLYRNSQQQVMRAVSKDSGRTWSNRRKARCARFVPPDNEPNMKLRGPGSFMELDDGTLLGFTAASPPGTGHEGKFNIWEWGRYPVAAYSMRSTDQGLSWSAPERLNGPPAVGQKWDLCECSSNVQLKDGRVMSLVRPVYSPCMWEVWSDDRGKSWGPATLGPFPCYAATALITSRGVILVSGRMPGLGLYASHDAGMTWKTYRIDTGGLWAMGAMYEVEKDLVFYAYMDTYESDMRAQFIRITADGVHPDRKALPRF